MNTKRNYFKWLVVLVGIVGISIFTYFIITNEADKKYIPIAALIAFLLPYSVALNNLFGTSKTSQKDEISPKSEQADEEDTNFESCDSFASKYNAPLFLEDKDIKVKLSEVYVEQDYDFMFPSSMVSQKHENLLQLIQNFATKNDNNQQTMIILANAGMGKSCLLQKLAFEKDKVFGENRRVFCLSFFALGELTLENSKDPILNICEHLNIIKSELNESVLFLDACDEIQTADDTLRINGKKSYIVSLFNALRLYPKLKVIITSRPNYIKQDSYPNSAMVIKLKPFDIKKINDWINLYNTIQLEEKVDDIIRNTLCNPKNDDSTQNFYGVPLFLYMIVKTKSRVFEPYIGYEQIESNADLASRIGSFMGKKDTLSQLKRYKESSKFKLYDDLFGIQGIQRLAYDEKHSLFWKNWEPLYILLLKIAYDMFSNNNSQNISIEKIRDIINKSDDDFLRLSSGKYSFSENKMSYSGGLQINDFKDLMMQYYGVSCYFESENNSGLKFVHPSIAEFYCAQYLYEMFFSLFDSLKTFTKKQCIAKIKKFVLEITGIITVDIQDFLFQKIEDNNYFNLSNEYKNTLEFIMIDYLNYLSTVTPEKECDKKYALIFNVFSVILSGISDERVKIFQNNPNALKLFRAFCAKKWGIGLYLVKYDFENIDLTSSLLSNSDLSGCDFTNATLNMVNLENSLLNVTILNDCFLINSYLSDAKIINSEAKKCKIINSDLTGVDFTNSNLVGADLSKSDFNRATLLISDIRFAILTETESLCNTILGREETHTTLSNADSFKLAFGGSTAITISQIPYFAHHPQFEKLSIFTNDGIKLTTTEEQIQEFEKILSLENEELMYIYLQAINYSKYGNLYLDKVKKLANYLHEKRIISIYSLENLATTLSELITPDYENSLHYHNLALKMIESEKDSSIQRARILKNMGDVLCEMKRLSESAERYESAKIILSSLPDYYYDFMQLLISLAKAYRMDNKLTLAEETLDELCNICDNCDFNIDNAIAIEYYNLNMPKKARPWFNLSLSKISDDDDWDNKLVKATITANYGDTFIQKGLGYDFLKALNYYNDSLNILSNIPNHPEVAKIYYKIASGYIKEKNYTEALDNLTKSISIYFDNYNPDYIESFKKTYDFAEEICPKVINYSDLVFLYYIGKKYIETAEHHKQKNQDEYEHFLIVAFAFIYYSKEEIDDEVINLFSMLESVHYDKSNSRDNFSTPFVPWLIFKIGEIYSHIAQIYYDLDKTDFCSKFSTIATFLLISQNGMKNKNVQKLVPATIAVTPAAQENYYKWWGTSMKHIFSKISLLLNQSKYEEEYLYFAILSNIWADVFLKKGMIDEVDFSSFPKELVDKAYERFTGEKEEDNDDNFEIDDIHSNEELPDTLAQNNIDIEPLDKLPPIEGDFFTMIKHMNEMDESITKNNRTFFSRLTGESYKVFSSGMIMTMRR